MKNKTITIILSLIIILGVAVPVFAANQQITTTGKTEVSYVVGQTYTVSIPANFEFSAGNLEQEQTVSASEVRLEDGKALQVIMASSNYENGYTLNLDSSKIPYSIKQGNSDFENGSVVLSVSAGSTEGESSLTFSTTEEDIAKATLSGTHKDTLTFNVSIN